jgi:hypothetical protein
MARETFEQELQRKGWHHDHDNPFIWWDPRGSQRLHYADTRYVDGHEWLLEIEGHVVEGTTCKTCVANWEAPND